MIPRHGSTVWRVLALALDAGYLAAWWLAPGVAWAPWAVAAGLGLAAWTVARRLARARAASVPTDYVLPLLLPATSAGTALRATAGRAAAGTAAGPPSGPGTPVAAAAAGDRQRRAGLAVALAALAALAGSGQLGNRVADPLLAPLDERAAAYVDRALLQAGSAYLGTRVLDRLFAVAADIQVDLFLVQGRPGQVFDPLRDLLDRFSTVVLIAIGSLTLQKVLLELSGDLGLAVFGAAGTAVLGLALAAGHGRWRRPLASAAGLLLGAAILLRLLLPLAGIGVAALSERVLAEREDAALATVERAAGGVGIELDLRDGGTAPERDLGAAVGDLQESARRLREVDTGWLQSLFDAFVELTAVFVIETVVAPLLVLALLWALARRLAGVVRPPPG